MSNPCDNCLYTEKEPCEYPCSKCKHTKVTDSEEYKKAPEMYQSKDSEYNPVSKPSHYTDTGIECIDVMEKLYGSDAV